MNEEQDIVSVDIDLGVNRRKEMNESWLAMFGGAIKMILRGMFGGDIIPPNVTVRGNPSEVRSFANAMQKEKKYIEAYNKYGLNDPKTYRSKSNLRDAVSKFERVTGIKWPFK
jgi:hypothetical protein